MNTEFSSLIQKAITEGLTSVSWIVAVVGLIGAGAGAFIGSYLKKSGEQRAIKSNFEEILRQLREQTTTTEKVKADVAKELTLFTQKLERRSEFEQYVLLERYKLVCEFAYRLSRITTDLNRSHHGSTIEGLFDGMEVVPLTAVYEGLAAKSFQLSSEMHDFFYEQAGVVLRFAGVKDEELRRGFQQEYLRNLDRLKALVWKEFGTDKISWS